MTEQSRDNSKPSVKVKVLGRLIRSKRKAENLTLSQAEQDSGVSAATLSRLERQVDSANKGVTPGTRTLTALARWLEVPVEQFLEVELPQRTRQSTPDIVETYLRADRNLDPDKAAALGEMFRLAYEQFSKSSTTPPEGAVSEKK